MWPQVKEAKEENRHELLIVGKELNNELSSSNGILDPSIFNLNLLNFLRLAHSSLENIPEEIGNLQNLSSLELQNNKLLSLPSSLGKLTKLKLLDVSENKLKSFPEDVNGLQALTTLIAKNNSLQEIKPLEGLQSLSVIDVRNNKLKGISEICHENHNSVTELLASGNEISEISENIKNLINLKNLALAENNIKQIPSEILQCTKLKEIDLKGNPLSDRRFKKLVESDRGFSRTVLDYLRQHLKPKGKSESSKNKKKGNKINCEIEDLCSKLTVMSANQELIVIFKSEVKAVRGFLVCCIFKNLDLSASKLKTFLSIQTKLHETICEKRVTATIATHDVSKLKSPLTFCAKPPEDIMIQPLNRNSKVSAREFYKHLQDEAEVMRKQMKRNSPSGIHKYLSLVGSLEKWPCLTDSEGTVLSLPPLTNADNTKIENETKDVFVEVTSNSSLKVCKEVVEALILETLSTEIVSEKTEKGKKSMLVEQVRVLDEDSILKIVFPSRTDLVFEEDKNVSVVRM